MAPNPYDPAPPGERRAGMDAKRERRVPAAAPRLWPWRVPDRGPRLFGGGFTCGKCAVCGCPSSGGGADMIAIRRDDLEGEDTRALLALHLAGMRANSPPESVFALDLSGLQRPEVTVWTAWIDQTVVGVAALKDSRARRRRDQVHADPPRALAQGRRLGAAGPCHSREPRALQAVEPGDRDGPRVRARAASLSIAWLQGWRAVLGLRSERLQPVPPPRSLRRRQHPASGGTRRAARGGAVSAECHLPRGRGAPSEPPTPVRSRPGMPRAPRRGIAPCQARRRFCHQAMSQSAARSRRSARSCRLRPFAPIRERRPPRAGAGAG